MPSQKNIQQLEEVKQKVDRAQALYFVDYAGLTHQQLEEARRELAANDSEVAVIKNTLMNLALQERKVDAKEKLQGPQATLFAYSDAVSTAKILAAFIKKYGLPKIKFGYFEGEIIDESMIDRLSKLPTRDVLIAKLLGTLNAPISNFVYGLNANIVKLAQLLKAIEEKKGQAAPIVADAAPAETNEEPAQTTASEDSGETTEAPAEVVSEASEVSTEEVAEPTSEITENNEETESEKGVPA